MRTLNTLIFIVCCAIGMNAQCYDNISLLNPSDTDCSDGMVTLNIDIRAGSTGAGNTCVIIEYTNLAGQAESLPQSNLQGPLQITIDNIDCDFGITFISRTSPNCGGNTCFTVSYPTVDDFVNDVPLPIELNSFDVSKSESNAAKVSWETSTEIDNDYFLVERSSDGKEWNSVGKVMGSGNTSEITAYEFLDRSVPVGKSYYRLIDVDYAGNRNASHIISFDSRKDNGFLAYPNPVKDALTFEKLEPNDKVSIFSQDGKLIFEEITSTQNNFNYNVDFSSFHSGVYMVRVIRGQKVYTDRVIKN